MATKRKLDELIDILEQIGLSGFYAFFRSGVLPRILITLYEAYRQDILSALDETKVEKEGAGIISTYLFWRQDDFKGHLLSPNKASFLNEKAYEKLLDFYIRKDCHSKLSMARVIRKKNN